MAEDPKGRPVRVAEEEFGTFEPPPALPKTAQALADKEKDLVALRDAAVESAGVSGPLWISYLFVLLYLAISAGAVTHKDLFLERPVKLPFLGIDLPLTGFFALGPVLFLILHIYVLLHFVLLAGKVAAFDRELSAQLHGDDEAERRTNIRRQLPSNIFIQFLAGPRDVREHWVGWALSAVAWISLVFGPVLLLVFFQIRFLPYHHETLTWWHRIAVVIDIFLLWWLWPKIVLATGDGGGTRWARAGAWAMKTASVLLVLLVWWVATFPGEWLHTALPSVRFIPSQSFAFLAAEDGTAIIAEDGTYIGESFRTYLSVHDLFVAGSVDHVNRRPNSLFSNVLVLPGVEAYDPAKFDEQKKFAAVRETVSLRGRHLEGAVLIDARLRKADLTGAFLQAANLTQADLREAHLACAHPSDVLPKPDDCTQLQGASLGAAQLQAASLVGAQLQGASFVGAQLQGALLGGARLQGASLDRARLQGASLGFAQLQGTLLASAQLQGAELGRAGFQGASLDRAQLQGASLLGAQFQGATLVNACVWRADVHGAELDGAWVFAAPMLTENPVLPDGGVDTCDWTAARRLSLRAVIEQRVPAGHRRDDALRRLDASLLPDPPEKGKDEDTMVAQWRALERHSPDDAFVEARRAVGCDANNAPYVARGLLGQMNAGHPQGWERKLAGGLLDSACAGAAKLSEAEKARLARIRDWVPPSTPGR